MELALFVRRPAHPIEILPWLVFDAHPHRQVLYTDT